MSELGPNIFIFFSLWRFSTIMARVPNRSHTYEYIGSKFWVSRTPPHKWPKYVANASFSPRIPNGSGEGSASGTSVGRQGPKQPNSICILGSVPNLRKEGWKNKHLKKRRVLQCFLGKAGVYARTHGTNILKIIVTAILLQLNLCHHWEQFYKWPRRMPLNLI